MIDLLTPVFEIGGRNSGELGQSHATVSQVLHTSLLSGLQPDDLFIVDKECSRRGALPAMK